MKKLHYPLDAHGAPNKYMVKQKDMNIYIKCHLLNLQKIPGNVLGTLYILFNPFINPCKMFSIIFTLQIKIKLSKSHRLYHTT